MYSRLPGRAHIQSYGMNIFHVRVAGNKRYAMYLPRPGCQGYNFVPVTQKFTNGFVGISVRFLTGTYHKCFFRIGHNAGCL